ncbi:disintegrin and metalloproteinase domain-containing protein 25-like [Dipodomys merriami]|uniref:disintegrin and metalloproteinase domain-containing protein 25-like n=1 Tax=Dipodomys merriami TaxID=94247 RepID=UPI00384DB25E
MMAELKNMLHMWITVLQLWFGLSLCLSEWPQTGQAQYESPPEVVIPLKVAGTGRGTKTRGWLSYSLYFGGQRHIVHMKAKKLLISRRFSVFTYTDKGDLLEDWPYIQNDCYYQGYVEGNEMSMVAINTCFGGFQGTIQVNDIQYEIKPKIPSNSFEHVVYKTDIEEENSHPLRCALTEEEIENQLKFQENDNFMMRQSGYEGWWTHRAFLELILIVDNQRYNYRQSNLSHVLQDVFFILNELDKIFSAIDLEIHLIAVEVWTTQNFVAGNNTGYLLDKFCDWKEGRLDRRIRSDAAHLLIHQYFGMFLGKAYVGGICMSYSCGVERLLGENLVSASNTIAHEMSHGLGMAHDGRYCTCGQKNCLMAAAQNPSVKFSNCSYASLVQTYRQRHCLRLPADSSRLYKFQLCGNGVIDDGEECDCGSKKLCETDPCCLANCTLTAGSECASGLCCKDCHFLSSGTLCREQENHCDLPEWCNGTSPDCPDDVYMTDGSPCLDTGYCYENRCNDRDEQCQKIFGEEARNANETCYRHVNTKGDRSGNCGIYSNRYVSCGISDILCGRVQCDNVSKIPLLEEHYSIHWDRINDFDCWGTDFHWGMSAPDLGEIKDGTECGEGHMCLNRKCVPKPTWESECSPGYCNLQGICNNKHHCHCNYGWSPPFCEVQGFGGSVDSGPPPVKVEEPRTEKRNFYLIPIFLFTFFIVLIALSIVYLKRENII